MLKAGLKYWFLMLMVFSNYYCKKSYAPPETNANNLFLSVDGMINTGANGVSSFKLTRSQNLSDTVPEIPEPGATVSIQTTAGSSYPLIDTGSNGVYVSDALTLDPTQQYILKITTADGRHYVSDPVTPKATPPIDSLSWTLGFDAVANTEAVNIYLNTHDPSNNTRFYRWDFIDTWEHQPQKRTFYMVKNKTIDYISDTTLHNWHCWSNGHSTDILLGTSSGLSEDVISQAPIARIDQNDLRMDVKYSALVRQYALDAPGYDYWKLLQQISQSLGGLFDIQPAQLTGNIHNPDAPAEPVYGFVSASNVQEKRIFISNSDLPGWKSDPTLNCSLVINRPLPGMPLTFFELVDPKYSFFGFDESLPPNQLIIPTECIDCTFQGGSTVKPSFWQ